MFVKRQNIRIETEYYFVVWIYFWTYTMGVFARLQQSGRIIYGLFNVVIEERFSAVSSLLRAESLEVSPTWSLNFIRLIVHSS